jgi:hypothetical protein
MFKPGVSGNPKGRPIVPEEVRGIPRLTSEEVKRCIAKYLRKNIREIHDTYNDDQFFGNLSALDAIVVSIIKNAVEDPRGDVNRLEFLIQRAGVPLKVEYDDSDEIDEVFDSIPVESLLQLVKDSKREGVNAVEAGER